MSSNCRRTRPVGAKDLGACLQAEFDLDGWFNGRSRSAPEAVA
jgi:hypothetical protein